MKNTIQSIRTTIRKKIRKRVLKMIELKIKAMIKENHTKISQLGVKRIMKQIKMVQIQQMRMNRSKLRRNNRL